MMYILFLVEKGPVNIDCLLARLLVCRHFPDRSKEQCESKRDSSLKTLAKGNRR